MSAAAAPAMQRQQAQRSEGGGSGAGGATAAGATGGIEIAPGVMFSDKLWSRLGSKAHEMEKQKRRNRMSDTSTVPEVPTAIFDHVFRSDATWKQR
jgi:hypothetical protein